MGYFRVFWCPKIREYILLHRLQTHMAYHHGIDEVRSLEGYKQITRRVQKQRAITAKKEVLNG